MRITKLLIRKAREISPLLPPLLRLVPSLTQAQQELRWIQNELPRENRAQAVNRRSRFEPLQYILGNQPFGQLEINVRQGVLIPRWETHEWIEKVTNNLLKTETTSLLDACTGSGCIPLYVSHRFEQEKKKISVRGFDVSDTALEIAEENRLKHKLACTFTKADLFQMKHTEPIDFVTANPPYIPYDDYVLPVEQNGTERSVREFEPELALVGHLEFYEALVKNVILPLQCKGFFFEVGYLDQVDLVKLMLPHDWKCGKYVDSAERVRGVVGWKVGSEYEVMETLIESDRKDD